MGGGRWGAGLRYLCFFVLATAKYARGAKRTAPEQAAVGQQNVCSPLAQLYHSEEGFSVKDKILYPIKILLVILWIQPLHT